MNDWFLAQKLPYVAVCQDRATFSQLFAGNVKRPDFLLLFEALGLIAVDAKNYQFSGGVYTLELEAELRRSVAFERLFKISVWYAYVDHQAPGRSWYFISALKAIEVGEVRRNARKNVDFLAIRLEHFEHVICAMDLARLYTHHLPGTAGLAAFGLR